MEYTVRHMRVDEYPLLEDFLCEAVFVPEDFEGEVSRDAILGDPKCRAAFEGFGTRPDDCAFVAEVNGEVVGACWVRTTDEYGHIDDETPSFSISLYAPFRGQGIGTALMCAMLDELREAEYMRASLSVQKENPALHLYERLGFRIVGNGADDTEWLLVCPICSAFPIMETERLILRPWLASDALALYELASNPTVGPAAGWPAHKDVAESAQIIATIFAAPETYAIVRKDTGELIGCAGFNAGAAASMPLEEGELELGYWIGKPFWDRGYATEAARAVIERGFGELGLSGIHAAYYEGNDRSRRVLEKLGFTYMRTEYDVACPLLSETRTANYMYLAACGK